MPFNTFSNLVATKTDKQILTVGGVFVGIALLLGLFIPWVMRHDPDEYTKTAEGTVIDYATDADDSEIKSEIFSFTTDDGVPYEITTETWSSDPAYKIGDRIEVYYDSSEPDYAWIKDDKNIAAISGVLQILGLVFGVIGIVIIALKMLSVQNASINNIGGLLGALAFGIPSSLAFPIISAIKATTVETIPKGNTGLSEADFMIALIFTFLGILVTVLSIILFRYQQKTGQNGVTVEFRN